MSKDELIALSQRQQKLEKKNQELEQEVLYLKAKVDRYERMNFAQKRERFIFQRYPAKVHC